MEIVGKSKGAEVKIEVSGELERFLKDKQKFQEAREKAVEAAGRVWADEAKKVTQAGGHIDTAYYVNSIGFPSSYSGPNGGRVGPRVHDMTTSGSRTTLTIGSGVSYAIDLEKRYNIFAKSLSSSMEKMASVSATYIDQVLKDWR